MLQMSKWMRTLSNLDNWSNKLQEEARELQEAGVEGVEKIHDEAFYMGAVMILICHDHQVPIPQLLHTVILLHNIFPFNLKTVHQADLFAPATSLSSCTLEADNLDGFSHARFCGINYVHTK